MVFHVLYIYQVGTFSCNPKLNNEFQASLLRAEDERDKLESELLKQKEKVGMVEAQVTRAQKDRENLQSEMEILLDRINKLSELLDKARVSPVHTSHPTLHIVLVQLYPPFFILSDPLGFFILYICSCDSGLACIFEDRPNSRSKSNIYIPSISKHNVPMACHVVVLFS